MTVATDTQIAALADLAPVAGEKRRMVYAALQYLGLATDEQIADLLRMDIRAVAARRNELFAEGLVIDSGERTTGRTGRNLIRYRLGCDPDVARKVYHKQLLHDARRILAEGGAAGRALERALAQATRGRLL